MKKLILLSILIIVGCEEPAIKGCTTTTACNYDADADKDDGTCIPKQGCNQWCEGNDGSALELDCSGNCGGQLVNDACGICDGNNPESCLAEGESCVLNIECESDYCDECGICGGSGIVDGACDCDGNVLDECCICGGNGIPSGACDCEGNTQDDDGDGICDWNDGDSYETVLIADQLWMLENLMVTQYSNGDIITNMNSNSACSDQSNGAYSVYDNTPSNTNIYGNLYNWYAVNDDRGICPDGWHVPSDDGWTILIDYLGGKGVAGGKMKETGITHWNSPNTGATNESGFTALPSGKYQGSHDSMGKYGYFWSNSAIGGNGSFWQLAHNNPDAYNGITNKTVAMSVRCINNNK